MIVHNRSLSESILLRNFVCRSKIDHKISATIIGQYRYENTIVSCNRYKAWFLRHDFTYSIGFCRLCLFLLYQSTITKLCNTVHAFRPQRWLTWLSRKELFDKMFSIWNCRLSYSLQMCNTFYDSNQQLKIGKLYYLFVRAKIYYNVFVFYKKSNFVKLVSCLIFFSYRFTQEICAKYSHFFALNCERKKRPKKNFLPVF